MRRISDLMGCALLVSLCLEACCGCGGRGGWGAFRSRAQRMNIEQAAEAEQMSRQAQEAFHRGDSATGLGLLKQLTLVNPKSAEAHHRLGRALDQLGRKPEAELEYRRALEIDPEYVESLTELGENQVDQGRPGTAVQLLDAAIEATPNSTQAHLERGKALEALGRTKEALAAYFRALESDPNLAEVQLRIATIQLRQGRNEQALARLNSAAERHPRDPQILYQRGLAHMQLRRPDLALADLRAAVSDPSLANQPEALYHLALALRANREAKQAIDVNRRALELAPDFAEARQFDQDMRTR